VTGDFDAVFREVNDLSRIVLDCARDDGDCHRNLAGFESFTEGPKT